MQKICKCFELIGKNIYHRDQQNESMGIVDALIIDFPNRYISGFSAKSKKISPAPMIEFSQIHDFDEKKVYLSTIKPGINSVKLKRIPKYESTNKIKVITKDGRPVGALCDIETELHGEGKFDKLVIKQTFSKSEAVFEADSKNIVAAGEKLIIIDSEALNQEAGKTPAGKQKKDKKHSKFDENRTDDMFVQKLATRQLEYLIRTTAYTDVFADDGTIIIKAGQEIDNEIVGKAIKLGKASDLIKSTIYENL